MSLKQKGLTPSKRKLVKKHPNQWSATPQQLKFMEYWLDPKSFSFGNAFLSATRPEVGYSPHYANQIAAPSINNKWLQEFQRRINLTERHILEGISSIALNANNSRSPDDTRLSAYEALAKVHSLGGYGRGNNTLQVTVVQPILGGESVKRTKVPSEVIDP